MNDTKQKGLITELQCQLAFSKLNLLVCQPIVEDSRYDFLIDLKNGKFIRVQCKTSTLEKDESCIKFSGRSTRSNSKGSYERSYSKDEIDYFYTYYDNISYLIPVEEVSSVKKLRFRKPDNGCTQYSKAEDYELKKILREREGLSALEEIKQNVSKQSIKEKQYYGNVCKECGKPVTKQSTYCTSCLHELQKKVKQRPDRDELKDLIRNNSMISIGKKFGVTDNTIRRWCDAYNLPRKKTEINSYSDEEWKKI